MCVAFEDLTSEEFMRWIRLLDKEPEHILTDRYNLLREDFLKEVEYERSALSRLTFFGEPV